MVKDILTYTDAGKHLKAAVDQAIRERTETAIARSGRKAVVIVGKNERDSIQSTLHLLSSRTNAARLRESVAQLDSGRGIERDTIEHEVGTLQRDLGRLPLRAAG
ncbi:MAG: prevent-host-death protein [Boseongicola sp. SB0675_bin_26]|nr:prevent-host-death protein [Boseongicola sp. SB0675_bin_26]